MSELLRRVDLHGAFFGEESEEPPECCQLTGNRAVPIAAALQIVDEPLNSCAVEPVPACRLATRLQVLDQLLKISAVGFNCMNRGAAVSEGAQVVADIGGLPISVPRSSALHFFRHHTILLTLHDLVMASDLQERVPVAKGPRMSAVQALLLRHYEGGVARLSHLGACEL